MNLKRLHDQLCAAFLGVAVLWVLTEIAPGFLAAIIRGAR